MNDTKAERLAERILELAVEMRDTEPAVTAEIAARIVADAGAVEALMLAAALIDVEQPVNRWWQAGLAGLRPEVPSRDECGSHRAYNAHRRAGVPIAEIDDVCKAAEREYQREAHRRQRDRAAAAVRAAAAA